MSYSKDGLRWEFTFPLACLRNIVTRQKTPSLSYELAKRFCPVIYVNPELFHGERGILARNLGIRNVPLQMKYQLLRLLSFITPKENENSKEEIAANSIFHFCTSKGNFPKRDKRGAKLWLLSRFNHFLTEIELKKHNIKEKKLTDLEKNEYAISW